MWDKPNMHVVTELHNYMFQPGDATLYRMAFSFYPIDAEEAYVLSPGVGHHPGEYIKLFIDMAGGTGVGVIMRNALMDFPEHNHIVGYLQSHGFGHVDKYTLLAVLSAVKVLIDNPEAINDAAKAMRQVPEIWDRAFRQEPDDEEG